MSNEDYYEYHETKQELMLGQLEPEFTEDDLPFDYCEECDGICNSKECMKLEVR